MVNNLNFVHIDNPEIAKHYKIKNEEQFVVFKN